MTIVFVPRESNAGESRVAVTPDSAKRLLALGLSLRIERGAGDASGYPDERYTDVGAELAGPDGASGAALVLAVGPQTESDVAKLDAKSILVSFIQAARQPEVARALQSRGVTTLAMELVPRISRAQAMDALSSQATVGGYKAVLLGATYLKKLCPLLMTAAGTVPPARVVVFGAGVAGLQAIATARRLGCVVEATDVRMAAKEQVESLGARFIEVPGAADQEDAGGYAKEQSAEFLQRQREEVAKRVADADIVITTAQVPGKRAPVLVDEAMVRSMEPGAVIVDMAVESGGNCALTEHDQIVVKEGVTIIGIANIPATVPRHASDLYSKNVFNLVKLFVGDEGALELDLEDEVVAGCVLTHEGEIRHAATKAALGGEAPAQQEQNA